MEYIVDLKTYMPIKIYEQIKWYTARATGEIGGLGVLEVIGVDKGVFKVRVKTMDMLKQSASFTHFEIDPLKADAWYDKNFPTWRSDTINRPHIFIWHSHVNMQAFMSLTDDKMALSAIQVGGFVVNLVINKRHEHVIQVDWLSNKEQFTLTGSMELEYPVVLGPEDITALEDNFKLVTENVYQSAYQSNYQWMPVKNRVKGFFSPKRKHKHNKTPKPTTKIIKVWQEELKENLDIEYPISIKAPVADPEDIIYCSMCKAVLLAAPESIKIGNCLRCRKLA